MNDRSQGVVRVVIRLRNGEHGYGLVAKMLHWVTLVALVAQFTVGYSLQRADDLLEGFVDRRLGGDEDRLVLVHVSLGGAILLLASVRLLWRRLTALPPWADALSTAERRVAHGVEQVLYACLFLIPLTGLGLVTVTGEDWQLAGREWQTRWDLVDDDVVLSAHVTTHVVFFCALATHVAMVLKHQLVDRDRLLRRML